MWAVALEYDDYQNHTRWADLRRAADEAGILAGVWFTMGANSYLCPTNVDFLIVEVESHGDREGLVANIQQDLLPDVPKAILTNFGGIIVKTAFGVTDIIKSREYARPLIDAGFECMTEVYRSENEQVTPFSMDFIARNQLGWKRTYPCFGIYGGATLEKDYSEWLNWQGWSVYLAEYLT